MRNPKHPDLQQMAGTNRSQSPYYALTASRIIQSEKNAQNVFDVIRNQYINPFMVGVDSNLVNISSGVPINRDAANSILSSHSKGSELYENFRKNRLKSTQQKFQSTIKRNNYLGFDQKLQQKSAKNKTATTAAINRDILGVIHAYALKKPDSKIDYEKIMEYPLSNNPLCLAHPDGALRKNVKADLKAILLKDIPTVDSSINAHAIVIDLVPILHKLTQLARRLDQVMAQVSSIIKNKILDQNRYQRIDIIADNYRYTSNIKSHEQAVRGQSGKIEMKIDMMIPDNFKERILHNNENKQAFISLYFKYMQTNREETLKQFACSQIFLSAENECKLLTNEGIHDHNALASNQPEADTRIILHASRISALKKVVIASPSGDTDIIILAVSLLQNHQNVTIIDGWGDNKREFLLSDLNWMMTLDKP